MKQKFWKQASQTMWPQPVARAVSFLHTGFGQIWTSSPWVRPSKIIGVLGGALLGFDLLFHPVGAVELVSQNLAVVLFAQVGRTLASRPCHSGIDLMHL